MIKLADASQWGTDVIHIVCENRERPQARAGSAARPRPRRLPSPFGASVVVALRSHFGRGRAAEARSAYDGARPCALLVEP